MKKKVVIVGFPGVGITELAKRRKDYVEMEISSEWGSADSVKAMLDNGFKVLISYTEGVCDMLNKAGIKFILVYPSRNLKKDICSRILPRDINDMRISELTKNWDALIDKFSVQECYTRVVLTQSSSYLSDLVVYIENLFADCK